MRRYSLPILMLLLAASACLGQTVEEESPTSTETTAPKVSTSTLEPTTTTTTTGTTTTTELPFDWDFSPSESPPVVILIDPGREPREVRVYDMARGTVVETTMRSSFSSVEFTNDVLVAESDKQVDFEILVEVTDVVPEGFVITSTFGAIQASSSEEAAERAFSLIYGGLPGRSTSRLQSPSGQILAADDLSIFSDLMAGLAGVVAPLPSEPIGIGAQWEVVSNLVLDRGGYAVAQTSTITLHDVDGSLLQLGIETRQEPGLDGLFPSDPNLEESLTATVSSDAVWNLSGPVPISASSESALWVRFTFPVDDRELTVEQTYAIRFELPSPAAGSIEESG